MLTWKLHKDFATFLKSSYLLSNNNTSKIKQIFTTLYVFIYLHYGFASIYYTGLQSALEGAAFLNVVGIITSSHQIFMLLNKDTINQLLDIFEKFHKRHKQIWEIKLFEEESKMIWKKVHYYCIILLTYQIICQTVPIIADSIIGYFLPNFPSVRVPLIAQGFIDFVEPRTFMYFLISIPSILWVYIEITGHVGGQSFILISIIYIRAELKIMNEKVNRIKEIFNKKEENYQNTTKALLKDVIFHHKLIIEALNVMNKALGFPIVVENTTISICFCLNFYGIMAFEGKGSIAAKFQGSFACFCIGLAMFWICNLGESLEDENNKIFQNIYDLPWYNENSDTGRTIQMMLRQTNKPFVINYHQRSELNLHTFMQIINASYSYFMMLKSTMI